MLRRIYCIVVLLLCCISTIALANQWEPKRSVNGINIFQIKTSSGYANTRGVIVINAEPGTVLSIMINNSLCQSWVYGCKHSNRVEQSNQYDRLDYTVIDSPLLFADRDMYIHSRINLQTNGEVITISQRGVSRKEHGGRVRVKNFYATWKLTRIDTKRTQVLYQVHSNPQIPPSGLLDYYMVDSVFSTLSNLQRLSLTNSNY